MPQEAPGPQTRQAPLVPCPTASACPGDGQADWKLTFFFQMPFTPGTASYSLLMASLQWTDPGLVAAPDPPPFPAAFPPTLLCGVWRHEPPQPREPQPPRSAAPRHGQRYVIPAGATSLLLFPPIDLQQCPSSMSLRAGWVLEGTAPPDPCSPLSTGPWEGGAPRTTEGFGWHWGAGEWDCKAVPGDLCPGVEVEGPHGAQHLNAPHVLRGEGGQSRQQNRAGNGEGRPGVREKGLPHQLQGSHSSFLPPPQNDPSHAQTPR